MPPGSQKKEYKKDIVTGTSSNVIAAAMAMARGRFESLWDLHGVSLMIKLMDKRRKYRDSMRFYKWKG